MTRMRSMGQEDKKAMWNLIAKKLAGEASPDEIRELERLLKNNPELHYPMQTISDIWNSSAEPDRNEAEEAFSRHLERMKERQIGFPERHVEFAERQIEFAETPVGRRRYTRRSAVILTLTLTIGIGL